MTDTTVESAGGGDRPAPVRRGPPRLLRPRQRDRAGRGRHHLRPAPGRDARPRRRVGLRQVHDRPRHRPGREGHLGQDPLRRDRADRAEPRRPAHAAHPGADDLPGPDLVAEPAPPGHRHRGRAADHLEDRHQGGAGRDGQRHARPGRHRSLRQRLPASPRVLRRPVPAHQHRPRPRPQAQAAGLRRDRLRARRVGPGADPQPAAGPEAGVQPDRSSSSRTTWPS